MWSSCVKAPCCVRVQSNMSMYFFFISPSGSSEIFFSSIPCGLIFSPQRGTKLQSSFPERSNPVQFLPGWGGEGGDAEIDSQDCLAVSDERSVWDFHLHSVELLSDLFLFVSPAPASMRLHACKREHQGPGGGHPPPSRVYLRVIRWHSMKSSSLVHVVLQIQLQSKREVN